MNDWCKYMIDKSANYSIYFIYIIIFRVFFLFLSIICKVHNYQIEKNYRHKYGIEICNKNFNKL